MINCNVQLISFPPGKVREAVTINEDESITVFLDKNDSYEMQVKRFEHAMRHIEGNDFDKRCAQEIECRAHEK